MARRSEPRGNPETYKKVFFKRNERIKVVACLDYSLEHKINLISIVAASFENLRGCDDAVLKVAANSALRNEYRNYGRSDGDDSFEAFLSEGSAFLRYSEKDTEVLQEAMASIQEEATKRRIKSQVLSVSPGPHTIPSNRVGSSNTSLTPSTEKTPGFENPGYPKKRPVRGATTTTTRSVRAFRGRRTASRTVTLSADIKDRDVVEIPEAAASSDSPTPNSHVREDRLSRLEKELAVRNEQLRTALQNIAEHKDHIFALSNRLSAAERECRKIEDSIEKATNLKDDNIATTQANLRYEISALRDQNIKMVHQREVISLAANGSLRPNNQTIREEFELLLGDMKDANSSVDILLPAKADIESMDSHIEAWSYRLTGSLSFGQFISHCLDHDISEIHFMTALAVAGATELVFESSGFPDFLTRASPMLDQYREHILLQGKSLPHTKSREKRTLTSIPSTAGPKTLSKLDLLAYHSILSISDNHDTTTNYFQSHVLTDAATALSKSLTGPLSHLISSTLVEHVMTAGGGSEVAQHAFLEFFDPCASQDLNTIKGEEPESPLAAIFTEPILRALKLKANLALSPQTSYKLVFPHPGEIFDPDTMIRNGESQTRKKTRQTRPEEGSGEKRVKLCLFPALYEGKKDAVLPPEKEYGVGVNVRNCLVNCDNFVKASEGMGTEGFGVVVKAVVLL